MADVLLTATGPDSQVYPVACNEKGELLLEEPIVSEGPQGPPGPEGPAGENGANGSPGEPGPEGPAGPKGEDGKDGQNGTDGTPGGQGPQGEAGQNGTDGAPGTQGPEGPQGPQGNPGVQGPEGPQGPQGPKGEPMGSVLKQIITGQTQMDTSIGNWSVEVPISITDPNKCVISVMTYGNNEQQPVGGKYVPHLLIVSRSTMLVTTVGSGYSIMWVDWQIIEYN